MKSHSLNVLIVFALFLSLLGGALTVTPARAATFSVATAAELIAAINNANTNSQSDTITLSNDIILSSVNNTTDGSNGLPSILSDSGSSLTIDGNGFSISRSGGTAFRMFHIQTGANVVIKNIKIENGLASAPGLGTLGGGIYTAGNLTVENSTFSGNTATTVSGLGSAIFVNKSNLTITNSYFTGNSSAMGTVYNYQNSTTITGSTFSNNIGTYGGGAVVGESSNITLINNTLTGNQSSSSYGGAVYTLGGSYVFTNNTIVYNSAGSGGGGIYNLASTVTLRNNIIAGNTAPTQSQCYNDSAIGGSIMNGNSYNIFGSGSSAGGCPAGATDIVPSGANSSIINLLANNGGPTQTMALPVGSPAIDAGNPATCSAAPVSNQDQRSVTRPIDGDATPGAVCDIGAFEYGAIIPVVTASNPSANATLTSLSTITVVFNQDMLNDSSAKAANNTVNYLLVERGANGSFDTQSCKGGVVSDDAPQTISNATYNSAGFVASLTLASPLTNGTYRLFICGTTSIFSTAGLKLNNGANDSIVDFTVNTATSSTSGTTATSSSRFRLPGTGFAPSTVTSLPQQPADLAYQNLGDLWLEIPSLNVKTNIVGVPLGEKNVWDVKWLGRDAGWLNGTAYPTWEGNSVITGHVYGADGLPGVFVNLKDLRKGDQIIVHLGSQKYIFEVKTSKLVRPDTTAFAFEHLEKNSYLTLITCAGYNEQSNSYRFRRVVRAVLIKVE